MRTPRTSPTRPDPLRESQLRFTEDVVIFGGSALVAFGLILQAVAPEQAPIARQTAAVHLAFACAVIAARRRSAEWVRAALVVGYALAFATVALVRWGPLVGAGATLVMASVIAARFFGVRGSVITAGVTGVVVALAGSSPVAAWLHTPASASFDNAPAWLRVASATGVMMVFSGLLVARVAARLEDAYARALQTVAVSRAERQDRLQAQAILASAADVDQLGTRVGAVAHDVNNSLAIILVNAELLSEAHHVPCENKDLADEMIVAGRRAAETTKSLLRLGRQKDDPAESADPAAVCERLTALLRRTLPESVEVSLSVTGGFVAPIEPAALEQLLLARALDARDASGASSAGRMMLRVKERIDARGRRGTRIEIHCAPATGTRDSVSASVSGEVTSRVGAATAERALARVGGTITFEQLGAETRVRIDLPAVDRAAGVGTRPSRPATPHLASARPR